MQKIQWKNIIILALVFNAGLIIGGLIMQKSINNLLMESGFGFRFQLW